MSTSEDVARQERGRSGRKEGQPGDAGEVPDVARHQDQVVLDGRGRDEEIAVRNQPSRAAQLGSDAAERFHDRIRERQGLELSEERVQLREPNGSINISEDALEEFAMGDDAHSEAIRARCVEALRRRRESGDHVKQPIRVDRVLHGRSIGRVPSSRQR